MAKKEASLAQREAERAMEDELKDQFQTFDELSGDMPTPNLYIQYKGVWDMDGLFKLVADFFRQNKFKFYEKQQRHRHPGPFGVERLYKFEAVRYIDEYHIWKVGIDLETFDEQDIEVIQSNGSKKMMTKGRLWIKISGLVRVDYLGKWDKSYFTLWLRKFYNKFIIHKRIVLVFWDRFYYQIILNLHGKITEQLKLETRGHEHRYGAGVH